MNIKVGSTAVLLIAAVCICLLIVSVQGSATPPTAEPTESPTPYPTAKPTARPTPSPTAPPVPNPTIKPTTIPTFRPTTIPTTSRPVANPTPKPTYIPTPKPVAVPTNSPTPKPTGKPTTIPTMLPTYSIMPTLAPVTRSPTFSPTINPTFEPSLTKYPTSVPTSRPTTIPTKKPTPKPTRTPVFAPTPNPSFAPSLYISNFPSSQPSSQPSRRPSGQPTFTPSSPSSQPSTQPSGAPTLKPTPSPSTADPSFAPTVYTASVAPSPRPTATPTVITNTNRPSNIYERYGSSGNVYFYPDTEEVCNDLEIEIRFKLKLDYNSKYPLYISTPGLTSGPCKTDAVMGQNLTEIAIKESNQFSVNFQEGRYENLFMDSMLIVSLVDVINLKIVANTDYRILIDRSVGLKRACLHNATWKVQAKTPDGRVAYTGMLNLNEVFQKKCFMFHTRLQFVSPTLQYFAGINMSFYAGFIMDRTTKIDIALPGFTTYDNAKYPLNQGLYNGSDYVKQRGEDYIFSEYSTNSGTNWTIRWYEAGRKSENHLFNNETFIRLSLPSGWLPPKQYWIYLPRDKSRIVPICGHQTNDKKFTYKVNSNKIFINTTSFSQTDAVGPGCTTLSNCNSHGICDHCTQKCKCYDGFGSEKDLKYAVSNNFLPDCSSRACPVGRATGMLSAVYGGNMHPLMECSNNGNCDRSSGECQCFPGYGGSACEKMDCPTGSNGQVCSGRGICTSIKALTYKKAALPLMSSTGVYTYGFRRDTYSATNTWDADLGRMCLCDSSWAVGFGSGETNTAEYFGPACEFRRCPTGDDPFTRNVDETNCEGKPAPSGGADVGAVGNKCHVDCSNRGVCDFDTGECHCLPGYFGVNCANRQFIEGHIIRKDDQINGYNVGYTTNGIYRDSANYEYDRSKPHEEFWLGVGV